MKKEKKILEIEILFFTPDYPKHPELFWKNITGYGTLINCAIILEFDPNLFKQKTINEIKKNFQESCVTFTANKLERDSRLRLKVKEYDPEIYLLKAEEETESGDSIKFEIQTTLNPEIYAVSKLTAIIKSP